jgi:hypothetical protein
MALRFTTALRNIRWSQLVADAGTTAKIRFYSGSQPAMGGTETTVLAELPMANPIGTVANGVLTITAPTTANGLATGTATWARIMTGANVAVCDLGIGTDIIMANTSIQSGVPVSMPGPHTLTAGNV